MDTITTEAWVLIVTGFGGFVAWMTSLWTRTGRILQRIDDIGNDVVEMRQQVTQHETRISRLEAQRNGEPLHR